MYSPYHLDGQRLVSSSLPHLPPFFPTGRPMSIPPAPLSTPSQPLVPSSDPPKPRPNRNTLPKLTVSQFTNHHAVNSALSNGRRIASRRLTNEDTDEALLLSSLLDRMARWAADISPHHDLAEFVVAAQAIAGNRELKQVLANTRLAELRQVTDAWETVKEGKRRKKRKIEVDSNDPEGEEKAEPRLLEDPQLRTEQLAASNSKVGGGDSSKAKEVSEMMKDPEVLARIERNRRVAIERRKAAANRVSRSSLVPPASAPSVAFSPVGERDPGGHGMDTDSNDVDMQQDVDMLVLAEMEHEQRTAAAHSRSLIRLNEGAEAPAADAVSFANATDDGSALLDQKPDAHSETDDKKMEGDKDNNRLPKSSVVPAADVTMTLPNVNAWSSGGIAPCEKSSQSLSTEGSASTGGEEKVRNSVKYLTQVSSCPEQSKSASEMPKEDADMDILDEFEAGAKEEY